MKELIDHKHTKDCIDLEFLAEIVSVDINEFAQEFELSFNDARSLFISATIKSKKPEDY